MKHIKFNILFLACMVGLQPSNAQSTTELDRIVKNVSREDCMAHAELSVCVYNITQGRDVYKFNEQRSMMPASMSKIFTTAIAFDQLGGDFRFKTTIAYDGNIDASGVLEGNIYIIGGGDPLLGSYRYRQTTPDSVFNAWYKALAKEGIRKVTGRILYDQSIFDNAMLHDTWQWGDIGNYYGTGICGLNFHENMYFAYFNAGTRLGHPAQLDRIEPNNLNIRNTNEVITGAEHSGDQVIIYGDPASNVRLYRGSVPLGVRNFSIRGALPTPATTCAEMFSTYLRKRGINISSSTKEVFSTPKDVHILLEYYSNTYSVLAQYINRTSNNMYAECVFKYLGFLRYGKGTFANGAKVIESFFKNHNLDTRGVRIVDGCGLSRFNLVTSNFTCRFLSEISNNLLFDDFIKTMAVAGKNGTARNLLTNLPSDVKVYVKSGTMTGIKSYCGYVNNAQGDQLCFCVMSNNHECAPSSITRQMETILNQIALLK
ncbi:MAG: D-alanyl-D-alanine carboxypeptidase/D-alanyl-D-alanine-endopeptidase [Bacteroidales bacterium]|nr:D-alanyl-D-alanine carboxypeptidase/D-alanyl-D-alanine-endopeptidase [Bacteroidales bacterium]